MDQEQQSRRWLTRKRVLWTVGIIAVIVGAYVFLRFAYAREWKWTGLVKTPDFHKRTLWDWLNLLIVPAVLALGGYLFTRSETRATQAAAERRAQDEALQAYLDQMGQMLLNEARPLRQAKVGDVERPLARAWTLTVLEVLDASRRSRVVRFLYEAQLIAYIPSIGERVVRVVSLEYAHLSGCDLRWHRLPGIDLRGANLIEADLRGANLSSATLYKADLYKANLREADLRDADLIDANLIDADLIEADLRGAAGITTGELEQQAKTLKGAIMPDGSKHP